MADKLLPLILTILLYFTMLSKGLASININENTSLLNISNQVQWTSTPKDTDIQKSLQLPFTPNKQNSLNLGYQNNKTIVQFQLKNTSTNSLHRYLLLNALNGKLELFKYDQIKNSFFALKTSGTDIPFKQRPHAGLFGAIPIEVLPGIQNTFFLTIESRHSINADILLVDDVQLEKLERRKIEFLDFYSGGIILLVIYNLFVYFLLKDKTYLYYCLYATSFVLVSLVITGKLDQIFPQYNFTFSHYLICFSSLAIFSANLFTYSFLELQNNSKSIKYFFTISRPIILLLFFSGLVPFFESHSKFFGITIDLIIIFSLFVFIYAAIKQIKRSPLSIFYLFSWGFILFSLIMWFGMKFGFFPANFITQNILPIGNMLEMLTLSMALAYKIQILNQEKADAQNKARDKEKYERLVRVLSHDIANSLTVIHTYSKKLSNDKSLVDKNLMMANKIYQNSENIHSILKIVREQEIQKNNTNSLTLEPINVLDCVLFSKSLYEEQLAIKKINLKISIPANLHIMADKTCFTNNILNNLLSNAIKFSHFKSDIEIFALVEHDSAIIVIKDHGIGIKENMIHDIFFSSKVISTTGTDKEIGHGLGSGLIREYMTLFQGQIQVTSLTEESSPDNHGTIIKLIFPKES